MYASLRNLPPYTQKADRSKLVRILCRGACGVERWAEMNVDYPGSEVLKKAKPGEFTATCLKCGYVAHDDYNWSR